MSGINDRIIQLIDYYKLSRYKFSKETGVSNQVLQNIYTNKSKPGADILEKILNKYSLINANWLITGKGEMFIDGSSPSDGSDPYNIPETKNTVSVPESKYYSISELYGPVEELEKLKNDENLSDKEAYILEAINNMSKAILIGKESEKINSQNIEKLLDKLKNINKKEE